MKDSGEKWGTRSSCTISTNTQGRLRRKLSCEWNLLPRQMPPRSNQTHRGSLSFSHFLISMRAGCGQGARCLSCLEEQTGGCLWWPGDQSRGHILRDRAKVTAVQAPLPCCALQLGYPLYTQCWGCRRRVYSCSRMPVFVHLCLCLCPCPSAINTVTLLNQNTELKKTIP